MVAYLVEDFLEGDVVFVGELLEGGLLGEEGALVGVGQVVPGHGEAGQCGEDDEQDGDEGVVWLHGSRRLSKGSAFEEVGSRLGESWCCVFGRL